MRQQRHPAMQTVARLQYRTYIIKKQSKEGFRLIMTFGTLGADFLRAMTLYAPTHSEGGVLSHNFHFRHLTVTLLAVQPCHFYVLRVIEVRKIGQLMYAHPLYSLRLAGVLKLLFVPACSGV